MFLRGMWHPTQLAPAPFGSWCAWVARAAGAAYWAWQRTQTPLPAGVANRSRSARRSSPCGSWQVTQDIWRAQPPSKKSRPSPEVIELPPGRVDEAGLGPAESVAGGCGNPPRVPAFDDSPRRCPPSQVNG